MGKVTVGYQDGCLAPLFVTTMSILAAIYQLWDLFNAGSYVLMALDVFIIILAIFVILESASAFTREKKIADAGVTREETTV